VKVFVNGRLAEAGDTVIDPADRGLTLGDGVFETMAVHGGRIARLAAHLARLRHGAGVLGFAAPMADGDLGAALDSVVQANAITEGVLRLTCTRGPAPRGLLPPETPAPSLIITGAAKAPGTGGLVTAVIATATRRNEHSPLSRIKSLNYLDNILAAREAAEKGADEALLLNGAGNLASASAANLFAVIDGELVTPPASDGVLEGVMRADVLRVLGGTERTLSPGDLAGASEAFLTNCLSVRPLTAVDRTAIGDGRPGPVTEQAQKLI
jgi:branched-chain amino acid aminotransferase